MPRVSAAIRRLPALVLFLAVVPAARAQDGSDALHPKYLPARVFSLPFSINWNDGNRQLKLFVSANNGTTWDLHATAQSPQRAFDVRLDRDGPYAFAIQTIKSNDQAIPATPDQLRPMQYVVIDTERPTILLRPLQSKPSQRNPGEVVVGVQWDVQDDHLDPRGVRLEVRWAGQGVWRPILDKQIGPQGEDTRSFDSRARMEYRLTARDLAGNEASQVVVVGAGGGANVGRSNDPGGTGHGRGSFRLLNSMDIVLPFSVREKGPSGIANYDLWMTIDRKEWKKVSGAPFTEGDKPTVTYHADKDAVYGFTIIAHSRANLSYPAPKDGDEPQFWVEVDTTKPEAKFLDVKFASPNDARAITVTWIASDKNLEATPILLEYRVKETDKWQELAPPMPNTGKYTVATPQLGTSDYQFFLQMRVIDRAGNQLVVPYEKPIIVDLIRPHIEITDAMPAKPAEK
ncbi:MAG: hypothetical protein ACJ8F7_13975 [Gemmataceae bacterium]